MKISPECGSLNWVKMLLICSSQCHQTAAQDNNGTAGTKLMSGLSSQTCRESSTAQGGLVGPTRCCAGRQLLPLVLLLVAHLRCLDRRGDSGAALESFTTKQGIG